MGHALRRNAASAVPAPILIRESQDAELLVVGSRGAGGFVRLMAGSVCTQAVHHARCPVVIIPGPRED
jgi:nucleotide-binding universal stress UspA family protein